MIQLLIQLFKANKKSGNHNAAILSQLNSKINYIYDFDPPTLSLRSSFGGQDKALFL